MYAKALVCGALTAAVLCGAGFKVHREEAGLETAGCFSPTEDPVFAADLLYKHKKGRFLLYKNVSPKNPIEVVAESTPFSMTNISMNSGDGFLSLALTK